MSSAMDNKPSRVFAAVLPASAREVKGDILEGDVRTVNPGHRELRVTGTAELCCPADRASVRVCVSNSKESVNEVTNSVSRRLDYVLQCVRQHGVKDEDTSVRKFLHREADLYHMDAEVVVTFFDFEKMEQVCRVLLEKLDKSVIVGTPNFYHSPECLSQLRRSVCASAVVNAQQKATDVSQLLGQILGAPQLVSEEEITESRNNEDEDNGQRTASCTNLPNIPSITAFSRVSISFSLKDGNKKKL